jgi:anti-sigma factor RsiW
MMGEDRNPSNDDMLRRLLGPQGPELSCEECFAELDRYVELELRDADADARIPGMREHLEGCSACAEDHRSLRALVESETGSAASPRGD